MATLRLDHITKQFPGVRALDDVSMAIAQSEIHALCGENGAGKSTLMNLISGNLKPNEGAIYLDGNPLTLNSPRDAFHNGIATVHQHLSLVESLSVAENIFANDHPRNRIGLIRFKKLYSQTRELLHSLNLSNINPERLVSSLSLAERQMVEIAKALAKNPRILILDEPTASLGSGETKTLFKFLKAKRAAGTTIIYISHRLEEIFLLADRISVLKDGKYQGTFQANQITKDQLITKMVGRALAGERSKPIEKDGDILFEVRNLNGTKFRNVSFRVRRGEILGLSGLVGAGRTEVARAICGIDPLDEGDVIINKKIIRPSHASDAINNGLVYLTEERKASGLFPDMSIQENIVVSAMPSLMPRGIFSRRIMKRVSEEKKAQLNVSAVSMEQPVASLSGGNQQKVMLAKCLLTNPLVLIVDEPTHGIDVGAKQEIYELLRSMADDGKGVVVISSELPELIALCHRVIVMKAGKITGEVSGQNINEESLMQLAT